MRAQLQELLEIDKILGVMFLTFDGEKIFEEFNTPSLQVISPKEDWAQFVKSLEGAQEADFLFENKRFYFRRADNGYLLVIMENDAPAAMVRLSCDTIIPAIKAEGAKAKKGRGLFNIFK
jgi:hypothetical protein